MALTLSELESAYNSLVSRIEKIERQVAGTISTQQFNGVTLLLEKDIQDLREDVDVIRNRMSTVEENIEGIV